MRISENKGGDLIVPRKNLKAGIYRMSLIDEAKQKYEDLLIVKENRIPQARTI